MTACIGLLLVFSLVDVPWRMQPLLETGEGGFITRDDEVAHVASAEDLVYRDVKPNQAVLVDEYDGFYDLDSVLNVSLRVRGPQLGDLSKSGHLARRAARLAGSCYGTTETPLSM